MRIFLTLFALLLTQGVALHAEILPEKQTVSYTGINGKPHNIEIYSPEGHSSSDAKPCFIFFHGGGWRSGDLNAVRTYNEYLTGRGMVVISANYSMHPKAGRAATNLNDPDAINKPIELPEGESRKRICVIDGKTVVRWAKQHADQLGIDVNRIVVSGASAGAHIGVLQMMDDQFNNPTDPINISTDAQAFVLFCPAFTLPKRDKVPDVNIFQHANKSFPPTLFIVGEQDNWKSATDALCEQLAANGQPIEVWMGPGDGHMFHRTEPWRDVVLHQVDEFLVANGLLDPAPNAQAPRSGKELVKLAFQ